LLRRLVQGGIRIHAQIVLVPGYNDGPALRQTLDDLEPLHPGLSSVAIVPVGLTAHRQGCPALRAVTAEESAALIDEIGQRQASSLMLRGARMHYLADEFYLRAGRALPAASAYEDFPQVENGVGLIRRFEADLAARRRLLTPLAADSGHRPGRRRVAVITGLLFAPLLEPSLKAAVGRTGEAGSFDLRVLPVQNRLFGAQVTVAGLLGGREVEGALRAAGPWDRVLLPAEMVNADGLTLDDVRPEQLAAGLGVVVQVGWAGPLFVPGEEGR
jgi:NifB/MoaA-like Fe-S oxidoreductase